MRKSIITILTLIFFLTIFLAIPVKNTNTPSKIIGLELKNAVSNTSNLQSSRVPAIEHSSASSEKPTPVTNTPIPTPVQKPSTTLPQNHAPIITKSDADLIKQQGFRTADSPAQQGLATHEVEGTSQQRSKWSKTSSYQVTQNPGQLYFKGTVPDSNGHGVGLSQWGAYGAAQAAWNYKNILGFYYQNTAVEKRPGVTINVSGYGAMTMEDYVSALGEVPSKACGSQAQINAWSAFANSQGWAQNDPRRSKYVLDNLNTVWDCWPEEAIKAQVVAARSYGYTSTQPICTTAACQVYTGDSSKPKAWAAYETQDEYVISKGSTANNQVIRAFYSAVNNNGAGTADNDTVWSDKGGNATAYSYLRSANDSTFALDYGINRTRWQTDSISISSLNDMILWCSQNCNSKAWVQTYITSKIDTLESIRLQKDPSNRVKKVIVVGRNRQSATIAGWFFIQMYNVWVDATWPASTKHFMNSITFDIEIVDPVTIQPRRWPYLWP